MAPAPQVIQRDVWDLFNVSVSLSNGGLSEYLQRVLQIGVDWFDATSASVFIRGKEANTYLLAGQTGIGSHIPTGALIIRGQGVAGACIEAGEAMLVGDLREEPALFKNVRRVRAELNSSMVIPLSTPEHGCVGVLNLSRRLGMPRYEATDLAKATVIGRQIALAVGNALLLAEARTSQAKLRGLVDSLASAVLFVTSEGKIEEANLAATDLVGNRAQFSEAVVQLNPHLRPAVREAREEGLENRPFRKKVTDIQADTTWWVVSAPLAGGTLVTIEDVSEIERVERERAHVSRLAEIGQMSAAIAHEIRNPLTGIRSAAQMLTEAPEQIKELAGIIEDEVMKLNSLCNEFLEFARPLALRVSDVSLPLALQRVAASHRCQFEEAGVGLDVRIAGEQPTIKADALRLEQVFRNLLINALQATPTGGKVIVDLSESRFSVEDTGCGMTAETLDRLFTPFFTTKAGGTGLGLSNVKKIVDAHGGSIAVKSESGNGTRFDVRIGEAC